MKIDRRLIRCLCGFSWYSKDATAAARAIGIHSGICDKGGAVTETRIAVRPPGDDHHCREDEPPQNPPASRADRDGACSWNCRGSYSPICYCPCGGERHGETHRWEPDERAQKADLDSIYGQIERAAPRGDWPGRKST